MEAILPTKGEWFTRSNRGTAAAARYADRPTDTIHVAEVNDDAKEIRCERFDGFDAAGTMIIGRRTTIRFATWLSDASRYTPCDAPAPPPLVLSVIAPTEPEPTIADLRADIAALRGEVARLTEALKAAVPQLALPLGKAA